MSATLAVMLKELDPGLDITIFEILDSPAQESSNAWNNAGTGHAALCELNYTPERMDGSIDISKALDVNTEFDLSRQFWSFLVRKGSIRDPQSFIHSVPHFSFVRGGDNVGYLKKRFEALSAHPLYHGMEYSDDHGRLMEWFPSGWVGRLQPDRDAWGVARSLDRGADHGPCAGTLFWGAFARQGMGAKLKTMIPSYGESLINNIELCRQVRAETAGVLNLQNVVV
jgi:malate:quinone-oxidoreductase